MESSQPSPRTGRLVGVGVGPGDPDLITIKALRQLRKSPVVAFPAGQNGQRGVAQQIIEPWLLSHQTCLPLKFPYVQDTTILHEAWRQAARKISIPLSQGKDVVFACEGDIGFYSTFSYLVYALQALDPTVDIRAVPGVCSPLAAAAAVGIPLTIQGQTLAVVPALYGKKALVSALEWADVAVLMKVGSVYSQVWKVLREHDLLERSVVVTYASRPEQQIYANLVRYPYLDLPYFSLLIVQITPNPLG